MNAWGVIKRLAVVTTVILAALNYVALVRLGFAGQVPDLNPLGASVDAILGFRDALGFEGKEVFNGTYRPLDFGFIVCFTTLLCLIARALRPKRFWWLIVIFAIVFCIADLGENWLVAELVNIAPHKWDGEWAGYINIMTRAKFAAILLAIASVITCWRQEGRSS